MELQLSFGLLYIFVNSTETKARFAMNFVDTLRDFQVLGSKDQVKCALGARVFLDLQCDRRITNLEKCYDSELNLVYLQGQRDDAFIAFIPLLSSQPLNLLDIENIQKCLTKCAYITLAVCDTSSNILYYQISLGIIKK
ncbi:uncharacterized protein LOC126756669 [Bactrocera neohumeralis]|uniref:uncharacterized protein LOC120770957 n=1 Tax=Bactrocera tryoni TaxID=59916 RepID=UPI001A97826C|nr:uncharacterized protein LOC120770957 [Bactrocera tryoni]XP_050325860.1 uncharacterized protein LOC126756669 [Bactrocera neohumeralis]